VLYDFLDMDALHAGLRRLIIDRTFRRQLGEAGRQYAFDRYSSRRMALDYSQHYFDLANEVSAEDS